MGRTVAGTSVARTTAARTTAAREAARSLLRLRSRRSSDRPPPVAAEARRFRGVVAYDGAPYAGWQRQSGFVAVQEMLEVALEAATGLSPIRVAAAGRTDAGVHAEGQVFAIDAATALPAAALRHLCDHVLPESIRVLLVEEAPPGFDPQRHATSKVYRYVVRLVADEAPAWRRLAWQLPGPLDLAAMREAASLLLGTHDFRAFRSDPGPERRGEDTVRRLDRLDVTAAGDLVAIEAEGPGFLHAMVRNLASALVEVGSGRRPPAWVRTVREARDRRLLPPPAPPGGLCLVRVSYADSFPSVPR